MLIVGIGGVGSVAAEMLTRCGIGRLLLFDYDRVELANLNRLFFRPEQRGLPKVVAAQRTLRAINPDVAITGYDLSVTSLDHYDAFLSAIRTGSVDSMGAVDLVLSCVDNYEARLAINSACLELDRPWMESGVSEDALNGHVQTLIPGRLPCYACTPPLTVQTPSQLPLHRAGVCAASLPTTMSLIAALLVQNALKHMLAFGRVTAFQGYSGLEDGFERWTMRVNRECTSERCRDRQKQWDGRESWHEEQDRKSREMEAERAAVRRKERRHDTNDWGIDLVASSIDDADPPPHTAIIAYAHDAPTTQAVTEPTTDAGDLSALLAELKRVQQ